MTIVLYTFFVTLTGDVQMAPPTTGYTSFEECLHHARQKSITTHLPLATFVCRYVETRTA